MVMFNVIGYKLNYGKYVIIEMFYKIIRKLNL